MRIALENYFTKNGSYPLSLQMFKSIDENFVLKSVDLTIPSITSLNDSLSEEGWVLWIYV